MDGCWTVTIEWPDGAQRKLLISDVYVQEFLGRSRHPDKDTADQATVLRLAQLEVVAS
jgi:hypothetical protein